MATPCQLKSSDSSGEVYHADDPFPRISSAELDRLLKSARQSPRKRSRICLHMGAEDRLHEMLIVKLRDTYVRPHLNLGKSKSYQMVQGVMGVVFFDENGAVTRLFTLGPLSEGNIGFLRISIPQFHTVIPLTDHIAFLETCTGPFRAGDTVYAPWAPEEADLEKARPFVARLVSQIEASRS